MIDKPQPKQELMVKSLQDTLLIYVASEDAREFVEAEAWRYGHLTPPSEKTSAYWLSVSPLYEPHEVAMYLSSYNTEEINTGAF